MPSQEKADSNLDERLFAHATEFLSAANLLNPTIPIEATGSPGRTLIPYIVMLAFAVELHLKTVAAVCGMNLKQMKAHKHKYTDLYSATLILGRKNKVPGIEHLAGLELDSLLHGIERHFVKVRYAYEMNFEDIQFAPHPSRIVLTALRSVLGAARPNWPDLTAHSSQM